jgi:hypothetical protein
VLDDVTVSLMSFLPKFPRAPQELGTLHEHDHKMNLWNAYTSLSSMPGWSSPGATTMPVTPRKLTPEAVSPPPAPKKSMPQLSKALHANDLVTVVEIMAKDPELAGTPLRDQILGPTEFPLEQAERLGCDSMIIEILKHHGADDLEGDSACRRPNHIDIAMPMIIAAQDPWDPSTNLAIAAN